MYSIKTISEPLQPPLLPHGNYHLRYAHYSLIKSEFENENYLSATVPMQIKRTIVNLRNNSTSIRFVRWKLKMNSGICSWCDNKEPRNWYHLIYLCPVNNFY